MQQPINQDKLIRALEDQTPKSGTLWQASQDVVPGGLLSLARKFKPYPFYTDRGDGAYIWDVDGNRYIDCCMSYGVLLLGHRPAVVLEALQAQAPPMVRHIRWRSSSPRSLSTVCPVPSVCYCAIQGPRRRCRPSA
ncbi:MAG: aminotransferase class III-fold pyridoxal phosphate-dependent enzyme [Anaerolineae bacterium]|jgi:4-aminobutyrate aminotransferase-like enzyme